ncbi:hypothetical protein RYX36_006306, partial [Vicia faba]
ASPYVATPTPNEIKVLSRWMACSTEQSGQLEVACGEWRLCGYFWNVVGSFIDGGPVGIRGEQQTKIMECNEEMLKMIVPETQLTIVDVFGDGEKQYCFPEEIETFYVKLTDMLNSSGLTLIIVRSFVLQETNIK